VTRIFYHKTVSLWQAIDRRVRFCDNMRRKVRWGFVVNSFEVRTVRPIQTIDITERVAEVLTGSGIDQGAVLVWCPHTTAGIFCNEGADPDVVRDVESTLERIYPFCTEYLHAEGNSHAHVRSIMMGNSLTIPVVGGKMSLGTWQHVFFAEFDGPRTRQVWVQPLRGL